MSNKHPQYLTANGLQRQKKRPTSIQERKKAEPIIEEKRSVEMTLSTTAAKRVIRKRRIVQRSTSEESTISPAAAKMIAEAIKGLLHS